MGNQKMTNTEKLIAKVKDTDVYTSVLCCMGMIHFGNYSNLENQATIECMVNEIINSKDVDFSEVVEIINTIQREILK